MAYYPQKESDFIEMKNIFDSLYVCIKIFYDLNAQVIQNFSHSFQSNQTFYRNYQNISKIILHFI